MTDRPAAALAERLREAHRRARVIDLPEGEKAKLAKRLIAITDAAKRDVAVAARRLDRLMDELEAAP